MSSSLADIRQACAVKARVTPSAMLVDLSDGRTVTAPLQWYPRLAHETVVQRRRRRLVGGGEGIDWPEFNEDVSVDDLLAALRRIITEMCGE